MLRTVFILLSLVFSHSCLSQAVAHPEFRGFLVDVSRLSAAQRQALTPYYVEQIGVIESVGLPTEMLAFMKTIPIVADPDFPSGGTAALYRRKAGNPKGLGQVVTGLSPIPAKKPVLLHEMLHAYDSNKWGNNNQIVRAAYQSALSEKFYPPSTVKSHFLLDQHEFFAISGTIYLFGKIQQEPFNCEILAKKQAGYIQFLEQLFGKHSHCS